MKKKYHEAKIPPDNEAKYHQAKIPPNNEAKIPRSKNNTKQ